MRNHTHLLLNYCSSVQVIRNVSCKTSNYTKSEGMGVGDLQYEIWKMIFFQLQLNFALSCNLFNTNTSKIKDMGLFILSRTILESNIGPFKES